MNRYNQFIDDEPIVKPIEREPKTRDRGQLSGGAFVGACIVAILFVAGAIFVLAAGTWDSVPPDKIMLHYTGGPFDGTHFQEVVQPGTGTSWYGLMENLYYLPATQRTYIISKDPNAGDKTGIDFLTGVSSDNVTFTFESAVYFKLNTDPAVLRRFFEQVCLHDDCTDLSAGGGWDKMLAQYFRPQEENALRLEAGKYTREQLYRDPDTLVKMQQDISAALKDDITKSIGGEFFCGPNANPNAAKDEDKCPDLTVIIKNPTPPDNVAKAYNDTAAASQAVVTAKNNADAKVAAAQGEKDAQDVRAQSAPLTQAQIDYIKAQALLACAQNTNCTLVVTDSASGAVNVNTGAGG